MDFNFIYLICFLITQQSFYLNALHANFTRLKITMYLLSAKNCPINGNIHVYFLLARLQRQNVYELYENPIFFFK